MPVICCAWCGTPFPGRSNAKYCNLDCYKQARKENAGNQLRPKPAEAVPDICQFNEGISCFPQGDCSKCGWNPEVAERRTIRILAQLLGVEVKTDGE